MLCGLPSDSLASVIFYDLSSFQVCMEFFRFPLMCMSKKSEVKSAY